VTLVILPSLDNQTQWWTWSNFALSGAGATLCGIIGGVVNNVLTARRVALSEDRNTGPSGWQHGIAGDIIIGAVVGLVVYLTGIPDVPISKILVASVIGGVSGAKFFSQHLEVKEARSQGRKDRAKSKILNKATDRLLESSIKEEGNDRESHNAH